MKQDEQTIKELKAILRTPRLYERYRKQLERALNEELARKAVISGDTDSLWQTI
jgi:hypothetical protein